MSRSGQELGVLTVALRSVIHQRDEETCQYCHAHDAIVIDHIVPVIKGGLNEVENLVLACAACNGNKGDKTLATWRYPFDALPAQRPCFLRGPLVFYREHMRAIVAQFKRDKSSNVIQAEIRLESGALEIVPLERITPIDSVYFDILLRTFHQQILLDYEEELYKASTHLTYAMNALQTLNMGTEQLQHISATVQAMYEEHDIPSLPEEHLYPICTHCNGMGRKGYYASMHGIAFEHETYCGQCSGVGLVLPSSITGQEAHI